MAARRGRPPKNLVVVTDVEEAENGYEEDEESPQGFTNPEAYTFVVTGKSEAHMSGATPRDIDSLLSTPDKSIEEAYHKVMDAQVAQCLQAGDVDGATLAIEKYEKKMAERAGIYRCPLNCFKRDIQDGNTPYIGAHAIFGGFRDSAKFLFPEYFYEQAKGKAKRPSAKHLRKFVIVRPNHVFLHRPTIDGTNNIIRDIDVIEDQQPIPKDVPGFARYEVIRHPFMFMYYISINPNGPFKGLLSNKAKVKQAIRQGANHGLGSRRSAGCGLWTVTNIEERAGEYHIG